MYIVEVRLEVGREVESDEHAIKCLTAAWRFNGQIQGEEFPIAFKEGVYYLTLMMPCEDSLNVKYDGQYVFLAKNELQKLGFEEPIVSIVSEDPFSLRPCSCLKKRNLILYTDFLSLESTIRCGKCFDPVPLYEIKNQRSLEGELHYRIISWQGDYQACDRLQMGCSTGERFGLREMTTLDSSLSRRGRQICAEISEVTELPTFYYLHRYWGKSDAQERNRKCPSCDGEWLLKKPLHRIFDFKCVRCHLLSNIACSLR